MNRSASHSVAGEGAEAAVALPQTVREPDWDYLGVMLLIVVVMCAAGFAVWLSAAARFTSVPVAEIHRESTSAFSATVLTVIKCAPLRYATPP